MIYSLLRPLLFLLPPETAHHFTLNSLKYFTRLKQLFFPIQKNLTTHKTVMGLSFPNAVGLGAGLDKNGEYIDALAELGFGFIEVGTITPKPQSGNPTPRLFRIKEAEALINRMGFNNVGVDQLLTNLQKKNFNGILGVNIGKNASTPLEGATEDYLICLRKVYSYASYIAVNVSSPNTPGLRQLQQSSELDILLSALKAAQSDCEIQYKKYVPLVIKISPDLTPNQVKEIAENLLKHRIDGVIATNTTLSRDGVVHLPHGNETGGLSGKPIFERSLEIVRLLYQHLSDAIPIIGCGGISSIDQAQKMYEAGASLVQVYSGLIYRGPNLIKNLS